MLTPPFKKQLLWTKAEDVVENRFVVIWAFKKRVAARYCPASRHIQADLCCFCHFYRSLYMPYCILKLVNQAKLGFCMDGLSLKFENMGHVCWIYDLLISMATSIEKKNLSLVSVKRCRIHLSNLKHRSAALLRGQESLWVHLPHEPAGAFFLFFFFLSRQQSARQGASYQMVHLLYLLSWI